ncbi:hypothetical protein [Flavobacterium soyangense]|uniref:Uncharacterized protein n=1 Tax=Flavobacterium soyangense TaxID=2023265 RepID=A0A930U8C1_9FLAO|nr:hypothetical protein [Flavobacterium soyangense]MBF2708778.1 hypothetical protein [Flavobacterium soyangense]
MSKEIFEQNPSLEKVFVTSDGQAFYNENDANNYAKNLELKTVETVYNENLLEVIGEEDLSDSDKEMAEFEAAEKAKAELAQSLADFDPETTKYPEALKLFKALGLEAENEKKDTIYPLLAAAKASAQEGVNTTA